MHRMAGIVSFLSYIAIPPMALEMVTKAEPRKRFSIKLLQVWSFPGAKLPLRLENLKKLDGEISKSSRMYGKTCVIALLQTPCAHETSPFVVE